MSLLSNLFSSCLPAVFDLFFAATFAEPHDEFRLRYREKEHVCLCLRAMSRERILDAG